MNEYDYSVMNPRTARTLYNKKDAFGVKHDTENEQSRAESDTVRAKTSSLLGKIISISGQCSGAVTMTKSLRELTRFQLRLKQLSTPLAGSAFIKHN